MTDDERQRLHRRVREQARRLAASHERQRRLEQLLDACHDMARPHARPELLLQRVADHAAGLLAAEAVGVLLLDGTRLTLRGTAGRATPLFGETGPAEVLAGLTAALKASEAVVLSDPSGTRAAVALPLRAGWHVIGVLALARPAGRPFSGDDVGIALRLAAHAATALDSARLYQEARAADRRKDEFLARLGHELRNPLGPIVHALHLLERLGEPEPRAARLRAIVARQVRQLGGLVDDLLDVSRIRLGKISLRSQPIDLREVARHSFEALQLSRLAEGHDVRLEIGADPVVVLGDADRLEQVVGNLLQNAVKYTPLGAPITLTVTAEGDEAVLRVRDRGIGIAPEMLAHVFQLFTQAHPAHRRAQGGLGLGLALVRALVECHGGTVTGDSAGLGQGSQFTVRLPRSRLRPAVAEGQGGRRPARSCRVVVVEDETDARDAMRAVLEVEGHSVASVGEGGAALEAAAAVRPEVMFIDLELPGMDGCELARRLRAGGFEHVCLVAVTGHGQPEDRRRTREAGFDAHLVKPVAPEQLFDVMAGVLAPEA